MQLFIHDIAHPPGLMTTLCNTFYEDEVCLKLTSRAFFLNIFFRAYLRFLWQVISEAAYVKWEDDVKDTTQGREQVGPLFPLIG